MAADADMVNVFRSADDDAEDDARAIGELLAGQGIKAVLLDDSAPDVPSGAWEVQVPVTDAARAEELIAQARLPDADLVEVSHSPGLDVETVFHAHAGSNAEMEAMSVRSLLEAAGIGTILVGDSVLPNLSFEVQVAKEQAEQARTIIREAELVGSDAAEQEERETEAPLNP